MAFLFQGEFKHTKKEMFCSFETGALASFHFFFKFTDVFFFRQIVCSQSLLAAATVRKRDEEEEKDTIILSSAQQPSMATETLSFSPIISLSLFPLSSLSFSCGQGRRRRRRRRRRKKKPNLSCVQACSRAHRAPQH